MLGVPDPEWGNRVVAFLVVDRQAGSTWTSARSWVAEAHPRSWAPRQLVLVDAIPLLANGKPDRVRLRELA